jgi:hypothetical protein
MSDLEFDGTTVEFNGGASLLRIHGVPTRYRKAWYRQSV